MALLLLVCAWGLQCQNRMEPVRPSGVSEQAHWTAGYGQDQEFGTWIHCSPPSGTQSPLPADTGRQVNTCRAWSGRSGELILQDEFVLQGSGAAVGEDGLRYVAFDGVYLELTNYQILEPLRFSHSADALTR